jgi:hypothetical protein
LQSFNSWFHRRERPSTKARCWIKRPDPGSPGENLDDEVVAAFQGGLKVDVSDVMSSDAHVRQIGEARPLHAACKKLGAKDPAAIASALEFVLEGLHLSRKLNKDMKAGQTSYGG